MNTGSIGISGIAYVLPPTRRSLDELHALGELESEPRMLAQLGFAEVTVADEEAPYDLALAAAWSLLREQSIAPQSVDALIYCGTASVAFARAGSAADAAGQLATTRRFQYPATRLQYDLDLDRASVLALDQAACTSLFAAVRVARSLISCGEAKRVLCVSSEFFPNCAGREAIYNCTADAAVALLVEAGSDRNRIVAASHLSKGYYWDGDALKNEIVASYFPTARHVIDQTITSAGWTPNDVSWVLPHNVSVRSWEILLSLSGISRERLWCGNVARIGHTLAGDNFINLRDALEDGSVQPGNRLLLFSYGFGAHWTALAIEA